ncbi:MAG: GNVR domain-containing protein, partial [Chloroflexota bacterium]|nr:GNVR domain-containing protein [Chloroflexota bacterium]
VMEEEIDLRLYVEVLIRNWKWIAGLALAAAAAAFLVSSFIPPTYETTALAAITEPRYVMRFDSRFETTNGIQPVYKAYPDLAVSDDLLKDLLAQLAPLPKNIESLADLRNTLETETGADPSMVKLVASSQDAEDAARIANEWAALFVAQANEIYGSHTEEDARFFEGQLIQAQEKLDTAEDALIEFQSRNQGAVLEARLASAQQDLQDYLIEQREIERAVRNAQALRVSAAGQQGNSIVSPGDNLAALLLQMQAFSIRTSRYDAKLEISDAALLSSERTASELAAFLDDLVSTIETWENKIEARVTTLESRILTLQQQLQETRVEEDRLTRARDVARETYVTLAHKVEEARIAAEDATGDVRLVSQAAVPEKPVGPRKMLNTAVAGALGLMVGVFGAFALEWWRESGETGGGEGGKETR